MHSRELFGGRGRGWRQRPRRWRRPLAAAVGVLAVHAGQREQLEGVNREATRHVQLPSGAPGGCTRAGLFKASLRHARPGR
eukprot:12567166-Prorocentrum_lima.AAC.1